MCQDGDLRFWDAIVCADVRCKEECASWRSASSLRREKTEERVVLSVDVGVLFSPEYYMGGQTKKERQGENHTCSSSSSPLSFLIFWFLVSGP